MITSVKIDKARFIVGQSTVACHSQKVHYDQYHICIFKGHVGGHFFMIVDFSISKFKHWISIKFKFPWDGHGFRKQIWLVFSSRYNLWSSSDEFLLVNLEISISFNFFCSAVKIIQFYVLIYYKHIAAKCLTSKMLSRAGALSHAMWLQDLFMYVCV